MKLTEVLDIEKNSIVSIVGAGGKTTLMFQLAKELKEKGTVLVTTTTKIYMPKEGQYDYLMVGNPSVAASTKGCEEEKQREFLEPDFRKKGIWVYGEHINEDHKLTGLGDEKLRDMIADFDYVLIEADGSKGKPLKGWREDEPVISNFTTCTIGVLSAQTLGMDIKEENIHRLERFLGKHQGKISEADLIKVIFQPKGLFKNFNGRKILYINQIDQEEIRRKTSVLISEILKENEEHKLLHQVIAGSLKEEQYFNLHLGGRDTYI